MGWHSQWHAGIYHSESTLKTFGLFQTYYPPMVIGLLADGVRTVSKSFQTIEQAAAKVAPISALVRHVLPGAPDVKDPPIETRSNDRAQDDGYARRMAVPEA